MAEPRDRVGLGWRPELAARILGHIERIDVLEVLADDYVQAPRRAQRALRTLAGQVPLRLHGVSLGLGSAQPVAVARLDALARLVGTVEPESWSEHLAFVRGAGREIGHLAAPPRCDQSVAAAAANLARARRVVGSAPLVENVATLIDPPGSDRDEPQWLCDVLEAAPAELLLDLHNLHANAVNFGFDAHEALARLPAERIAQVHVAGGRFVTPPPNVPGRARLLDDHLHDVPPEVYALLTEVGRRAPRPLTVILERDGGYPDFDVLLAELDAARVALGRGRELRGSRPAVAVAGVPPGECPRPQGGCDEGLLARLYSDEALVEQVLADPGTAARALGLAPRETHALLRLDRVGLALAARSFARKRPSSLSQRTGDSRRAL